MGAKVVGIIDIADGLINEEGFTFDEITSLFLAKSRNTLESESLIPFEEINKNIWLIKTEIFCTLCGIAVSNNSSNR